jgi:hypothetical protein
LKAAIEKEEGTRNKNDTWSIKEEERGEEEEGNLFSHIIPKPLFGRWMGFERGRSAREQKRRAVKKGLKYMYIITYFFPLFCLFRLVSNHQAERGSKRRKERSKGDRFPTTRPKKGKPDNTTERSMMLLGRSPTVRQ